MISRFLSRNIINQKGPDCKISMDLSSSSQILSSASSNTLPSSLVNFFFYFSYCPFNSRISIWFVFENNFSLCLYPLLNAAPSSCLPRLTECIYNGHCLWKPTSSLTHCQFLCLLPPAPSPFCPGEWVILSSFFACLIILLLDPERSG